MPAAADSLKKTAAADTIQEAGRLLWSIPRSVHLIHDIKKTNVRRPTLSNPELRPNQPYRNLTSNPVTFATTAKLVHGSQLSPSNHRHGVRFITCASEVQNTAPVYRSTVPTHKTTRNPARLRGRPPAREANTTCRPATSGSCGITSRCKQRRKPTTSPQRSGVDDDAPASTEEKTRGSRCRRCR